MGTDNSQSAPVLLSRVGAAAVITINRPEKRNALDIESQDLLLEILAALDTDQTVRGIVITGDEQAFSSGADLGVSGARPSAAETIPRLRHFRRLTALIEEHSKPVLAAISGWCLTGGLELAMCCDIRIADETAQFGITSSRLGSVAGYGGTQRLPRIVGAAKAKELLFLAEYIDAAEAHRIGLVNRVVAAGQAVPAALDFITVVEQRAPLSIQLMKQAVNTGMQVDLHSGLELELNLSARTCETDDRVEGARAFLEKRTPQFRGH